MSPFRLFITRQKLSNALKSLKSKKKIYRNRPTERASECHSPHHIYNSLLCMRAIHELKSNGGRKVATSRFSRSSALQCSCRTNDCSYLMISYFRGSFKIKLFAIVQDSRSFDVFDVFLTSAYFFCQIAKFLIGKFAYDPILLLLVCLQTKLDSTQSYYHYLLCTQIIKSDLRSAREI